VNGRFPIREAAIFTLSRAITSADGRSDLDSGLAVTSGGT